MDRIVPSVDHREGVTRHVRFKDSSSTFWLGPCHILCKRTPLILLSCVWKNNFIQHPLPITCSTNHGIFLHWGILLSMFVQRRPACCCTPYHHRAVILLRLEHSNLSTIRSLPATFFPERLALLVKRFLKYFPKLLKLEREIIFLGFFFPILFLQHFTVSEREGSVSTPHQKALHRRWPRKVPEISLDTNWCLHFFPIFTRHPYSFQAVLRKDDSSCAQSLKCHNSRTYLAL